MRALKFYSVALLAIFALNGCSDNDQESVKTAAEVKSIANDGPDTYLKETIKSLRKDDVASFFKMIVPQTEYDKAVKDWDEKRRQPVDPKDAANFAAQMQKLTADGAEDAIFAEIEPKLDQYAPQLPIFVGMGTASLKSKVAQTKFDSEDEKKRATDLVNALSQWASSTDFINKDKVKQSIGILCSTARKLDMSTIEEFNTLNFDQALQKAGFALAATKNILSVYDLSLNDVLDSMKIDVIENDDKNAKLDVAFKIFNTDQKAITQLVRVGDRWFSSDAMKKMNTTPENGDAE